MTDVVAQIVFSNPSAYGSWLSPSVLVDATACKFQAYIDAEDNVCPAIITKVDPHGVVIGAWRAIIPGYKLDGVSLSATGPDLLIDLTAHQAQASPRGVCYAEGVIAGVFAPYHPGTYPGDAPGAFEGGTGLPNPEYTLDEIANAVRDKLTAEMAAPDSDFKKKLGNTLRAGIKTEVTDAESALLTKKNLYGGAVPEGYDAFIRNRVWEVLDRNHLVDILHNLQDWINKHP